MRSTSDVHIRRLDPTLLLIFHRLLAKRNMSQVAVDLGITQSAVSHAVGRLRSIFGDPLFARTGNGVEPTPRALVLGPLLGDVLDGLRGALAVGAAFDPGASSRRFGLAAPDTVIAAIAPPMLAELARTAPGCRITFRMLPPDRAAAAVSAGEVDVAVGGGADCPKDAVGRGIGSEPFGVAARRDHPRLVDGLDLDTYCDLDHLLVSHDRDPRGVVDPILGGLGRARRLVAVMPHLMLAFAAASRSEAVITAPLRACRYAATLFPIAIHAPPLDIPPLDLMLLRHADGRGDPAIDWLEGLTDEALGPGGWDGPWPGRGGAADGTRRHPAPARPRR